MTPKDLPVGWIGVGKMGLPMAGHLVAAGCRVRAYDTVPARIALLACSGTAIRCVKSEFTPLLLATSCRLRVECLI